MKNAFCKFCGQLSANEYPDTASEAELIEHGTMDCNCYEAQQYQKRKAQAEKAKIELKAVCCAPDENHNMAACDNDIIPVLEKAIDLMSEQKIYKISLGVLSGGVVDIKATSSGKISIQRSVALKQKREIE